jgi:hypothetical protein
MALFAAAGSASATVIYSDFGAGGTFNDINGWTVFGTNTDGGPQAVAGDFTPTANFTLTSITLGFGYQSGTNLFDFALTTDASGIPSSGTPLETWSASNAGAFFSNNTITLDSVLNPTLTAGVTYWITAFPGAADTDGAWNFAGTGATGFDFSENSGESWTKNAEASPAFEVEGTSAAAVPTPAAFPAGLVLFAGLLCFKRFRKAAL